MSETPQVVQMQFEDADQQSEAANLGMWAFLATEILFFGGIFLGYATLRAMHPAAFEAASHHLDVKLGTLNTGLLLLSSLFMAMADVAVHRGSKRRLLLLLALVIVVGSAFLGIKFYEYHHEWTLGHVPVLQWTYEGPREDGVELFYVLYFAMTAMHATHMIVGIGVMLVLCALVARGKVGSHRPLPVEMTALYWHFVDIVWIFLFPMLYLIGAGSK